MLDILKGISNLESREIQVEELKKILSQILDNVQTEVNKLKETEWKEKALDIIN